MKIALLLTGYLRKHRENWWMLHSNLISKFNTDTYCTTWDIQENGIPTKNEDFSDYKDRDNLKKITIINSEEYNKNKPIFKKLDRENDIFDVDERAKFHGEYWVNRLMDQWYLVKKSFESIDNPQQYDKIIRFRYDIWLENFVLIDNNHITIPKDESFVWDYSDHMAYGNYDVMNKYCHIYDHIFKLYEKYNIDVSHAVNMLKFYIGEFEPKIQTTVDPNLVYKINK